MNDITKFIITWCLLLVYMGFVFGYMIELFTIERPPAKAWVGRGLLVILLITPSILVAYVTSRKKKKSSKKEQM
jgi:membrane protein DedA with SNARE-associated domain